eukprot:7203904-Prymnesium_polylepis.1
MPGRAGDPCGGPPAGAPGAPGCCESPPSMRLSFDRRFSSLPEMSNDPGMPGRAPCGGPPLIPPGMPGRAGDPCGGPPAGAAPGVPGRGGCPRGGLPPGPPGDPGCGAPPGRIGAACGAPHALSRAGADEPKGPAAGDGATTPRKSGLPPPSRRAAAGALPYSAEGAPKSHPIG